MLLKYLGDKGRMCDKEIGNDDVDAVLNGSKVANVSRCPSTMMWCGILTLGVWAGVCSAYGK